MAAAAVLKFGQSKKKYEHIRVKWVKIYPNK